MSLSAILNTLITTHAVWGIVGTESKHVTFANDDDDDVWPLLECISWPAAVASARLQTVSLWQMIQPKYVVLLFSHRN